MPRKLASFLAAMTVAVASIGAASADPVDRSVTVAVSFADLDLSNAEGVKTLSFRLSRAIDQACGRTHDTASQTLRNKIKACRVNAMDSAVAAIDAPLLTAMHKDGDVQRYAGL